MFSNYGELLEHVEDWLVRPDLSDEIPALIYLAEIRVQQDLKMPSIHAETTGNLSTSNDYISLPADCLELEFFGVPGNSPPSQIEIVPQSTWERVKYQYLGSGTIKCGTVIGKRLYLAGAPTAASEYKLTYRSGIEHLSTTNTTSDLLTYDPNLLLYATLLESAPFVGDDQRLQTWGQLYEDRRKTKRKSLFRLRTGGGPLRTRPDTITP